MRVSLQREPVMEAAVKYDVDGEPFFFIWLGGCQCNPERIRIRLYLGSHAGARARPVREMRIAGRGDQFGGHPPGLETASCGTHCAALNHADGIAAGKSESFMPIILARQ